MCLSYAQASSWSQQSPLTMDPSELGSDLREDQVLPVEHQLRWLMLMR